VEFRPKPKVGSADEVEATGELAAETDAEAVDEKAVVPAF
jgi:hypothetical protein